MKQKLLSQNAISKFLVLSCFLLFNASFGATFYSRTTGSWNSPSTWAATHGGAALTGTAVEGTNFPGPNDVVYITGSHTIGITIPNARCQSLYLGSTTNIMASAHVGVIQMGGTFVSGTFNLTISGDLTVMTSNASTASKIGRAHV